MLIEVHAENADDRKIEQIVHVLENDGLIVIPTDTIYAFAVSLNSKKGLEKLAKIKEVKLKKSEFSLILNSLSSIVEKLNHPLVSSSVHDQDEIIQYTTDPFAIFERHEHEVDAVVDCGFGNNVASTIVDCRTEEPSILRQGAGIID